MRHFRLFLALALAVSLCLLALPLGTGAATTTRYVSTTGTDVGNCSTLGSPCRTITYAIEQAVAGDTVSVATGTYTEQVEITKAITLQGMGSGTIIRSPDTLTKFFVVGGSNRYAIVYIHDITGVTIRDLVVDGAGKGNANNRFIGVAFRRAGGTLSRLEVKDVRDTPFSGAQHGVGIYVYNDDGISRIVTVEDCYIHDFQKNAMALNAGDTTPLVVQVQRNRVTGYGVTGVTAQNGIQVWAKRGSGNIANNTVEEIAYSGSGWVASSILQYYGNLDITGNEVTNSHMGVYNYIGAGTISGNKFNIIKAGPGGWGVQIYDPPVAMPSPFDPPQSASLKRTKLAAEEMDVQVVNNLIVFSGADNIDTVGIAADSGYGQENLKFTATHNVVYGFEVGIGVWKCTSNCSTGVLNSATVNYNNFAGCTWGMHSNVTSPVVNGKDNWWGQDSGPYDATGTYEVSPSDCGSGIGVNDMKNADGAGVMVSGDVDYCPWGSLQQLLDAMPPYATILLPSNSYPGGLVINKSVTLQGYPGALIGRGSPAITVNADDVTIAGPLTLDGDSDTSPGILIKAGADNCMIRDIEVREWADGIEIEGSVDSFKLVNCWLHDNTDAGLQVDSGATLGGIVTIEGNLFKENGGPGIRHEGTGTLVAEYNSWGHKDGAASGDGIVGTVDADPWTYIEPFLDMHPDTLATVRNVTESQSFDIKLKADAAKVAGLTFKFTYDTEKLTLNTTTFSAPWNGRCTQVGTPPAGTICYRCELLGAEWDATAGTIATFNFTVRSGNLTGSGPWNAYYDIAHAAADTSAAALGGARIYVNNAGYGAPSAPARDLTDADDGRVHITGIANFTGYVDLQARVNDAGAVVSIYNQATKAGATKLAEGTSASGGRYTTSYISPHELTIGTPYWIVIDAPYYLPTTALAATVYEDSDVLDVRPLTSLANCKLLGGDVQNDEDVDISDIVLIAGKFGTVYSGPEDINQDGVVNILDLVVAAGNYNLTASPWTP